MADYYLSILESDIRDAERALLRARERYDTAIDARTRVAEQMNELAMVRPRLLADAEDDDDGIAADWAYDRPDPTGDGFVREVARLAHSMRDSDPRTADVLAWSYRLACSIALLHEEMSSGGDLRGVDVPTVHEILINWCNLGSLLAPETDKGGE